MADTASTTWAEGESWPLAPEVWVSARALSFTYSRSGGPGGQNVNKLNTRCTLTVLLDDLAAVMPADAVTRLRTMAGSRLAKDPDRIVITSTESRSQSANREACVARLANFVTSAMRRPKVRKKTKPSKAAKQRRIESKRRKGSVKAHRRVRDDANE